MRHFDLWRQPVPVIVAVLAVMVASGTAIVVASSMTAWTGASCARDAILLVLALAFDEVARNVARLRKRLVDVGYEDMSAVWQFAAAAALPVGHAVLVVVVLRLVAWFRHNRGIGKRAYREGYTGSAHVLAVAAAGTAMRALTGPLGPDLLSLGSVLVGILVLTAISRLLIFGMIGLASGRMSGRLLIGSVDEYGLELASLCLGGLTGLALATKPLLVLLVLLPAYALQRGALVRELEVAASHDPKTGLLNPVAWQTLAKRELSRSARDDQASAVLIIDLDHFKQVNDRWGHVAGDAVLKAVGQCLREELRDYDSIGRFGGEEFVAILPDVDEFQAAIIAERLRSRIGKLSIASIAASTKDPEQAASSADTLSTSVGVACFPEHGQSLDQLVIGADSALYRAKSKGRNRVEFADAPAAGSPELAVS